MQLSAAIPEMTLADDFTVRFEAIDPATGDPVDGVLVSEASLFVDEEPAVDEASAFGPFMYLPGPPG